MSGSGRGRGWLRLGPNAVPVKPGVDSVQQSEPATEDKMGYDDLIKKFEFLNIDDDGIAINNKIHHIREEFIKKCPTVNLIEEAVEAIHEECLKNEIFLEKFVLFISSAHFENKQKSKEQILWKNTTRREFIKWLQHDFECAENLRDEAPLKFYNGLKLCSSYFYNSKKLQSRAYRHIEKIAILGYLNLLLHHLMPKDVKMITHLVCRHSSSILDSIDEKCPEFEDILCKLKLKLIHGTLAPIYNMLLFFAYEVITKRYSLTSDELEFYRRNMDEDHYSEILKIYEEVGEPVANALEKDTRKKNEEQRMRKLDVNGSDMSFIQQPVEQGRLNLSEESAVSSSTSENTIRPVILDEKPSTYRFIRSNGSFYPNKQDVSRDPLNLNGLGDSLNMQERVGRPILGVGARLKRN